MWPTTYCEPCFLYHWLHLFHIPEYLYHVTSEYNLKCCLLILLKSCANKIKIPDHFTLVIDSMCLTIKLFFISLKVADQHWYSLTNGIRGSIHNMKFLNFSLTESGKQSSFDSFETESFISLTKTDISRIVLCFCSLWLALICLASPCFVLHCFVHSLHDKNVDCPNSYEMRNENVKKKIVNTWKND